MFKFESQGEELVNIKFDEFVDTQFLHIRVYIHVEFHVPEKTIKWLKKVQIVIIGSYAKIKYFNIGRLSIRK